MGHMSIYANIDILSKSLHSVSVCCSCLLGHLLTLGLASDVTLGLASDVAFGLASDMVLGLN